MEPGKPPLVSKGTEVNTLVASGFWIKTELKAEMMGQPFEGHGFFGYDARQNAHVGSWVDNSDTWMAVTKGTCAKRLQGADDSSSRAMTRPASPPPTRRSMSRWTGTTAPWRCS